MATRTCITCGLEAGKNFFSGRQWRKGVGRSRCWQCVLDPSHAVFDPGSLSVTDLGARASVSNKAISNPFAEGTFRVVALGAYTSGPRKGQPCVMKWTKPVFNNNQLPYSADIYHEDIRCVSRTLEFVRAFNAAKISKLQIRVYVPTLHRFNARKVLPKVMYLREPYIPKFQKWNSNSGWVCQKSRLSAVMQALSHYSYHASGGNQLLCDLQGGWSNNEVILTDPVIMTLGQKKFCIADGGLLAIRKFFENHVCAEFCDRRWIRPQGFASSCAPSLTNPTTEKDLHSKSKPLRNMSMNKSSSKKLDSNKTILGHVAVQKDTSVFIPSFLCRCFATDGTQVTNCDTSVGSMLQGTLSKKIVQHCSARRTMAKFKKETVFDSNRTALRSSGSSSITAESSSYRTRAEWAHVDSIIPMQSTYMLYATCSCRTKMSFTQIAGDWINRVPTKTSMTATISGREASTAVPSRTGGNAIVGNVRPKKKKHSYVKRAIAFASKMNDRLFDLLLE